MYCVLCIASYLIKSTIDHRAYGARLETRLRRSTSAPPFPLATPSGSAPARGIGLSCVTILSKLLTPMCLCYCHQALMKFGTVTQFELFDRPDRYKFKIFKIQNGGSCHLEKLKKSRYRGNGLTNRHEIWHGYAYWPGA